MFILLLLALGSAAEVSVILLTLPGARARPVWPGVVNMWTAYQSLMKRVTQASALPMFGTAADSKSRRAQLTRIGFGGLHGLRTLLLLDG